MSAAESIRLESEDAVKGYLANLPKGTVIQLTNRYGRSFRLQAEGGAWGDFVHHKGNVPVGMGGQTSKRGRSRLFWSVARLAGWLADGVCEIELASPSTTEAKK